MSHLNLPCPFQNMCCVAMFLFGFVAYQKWPLLEYFEVDDDDVSAMVVATVLAWPDTVAVLLVLATTSNK